MEQSSKNEGNRGTKAILGNREHRELHVRFWFWGAWEQIDLFQGNKWTGNSAIPWEGIINGTPATWCSKAGRRFTRHIIPLRNLIMIAFCFGCFDSFFTMGYCRDKLSTRLVGTFKFNGQQFSGIISVFQGIFGLYEPRHDKTNKMSVRPAKTQISLGIRQVWSESSLSTWRKRGSLTTH